MIVVCPNCQAKYKFDENKLGSRPRARTKCAKCGGAIDIENPQIGAMTLPPGTLPPQAATPASAPTLETPAPAVPPAPQQREETKKTPIVREHREDPRDSTATGKDLLGQGMVELPKDKRYSLAVIQGDATGQIFQIRSTRTTIGRQGADVNLDDPEASRLHAAVEILGDHAILRDLGSTNGTYVEMDRIEQQVLQNHMEFRIGTHVLMFIVTDVE